MDKESFKPQWKFPQIRLAQPKEGASVLRSTLSVYDLH